MYRLNDYEKSLCYDIKNQRILGILDTAFNQNIKSFKRDGMNNTLELKKIAKEQFTIKDTSSIDQIISKRFFIDYNTSKRRSFILTSSDLEGCCGRILHTAADLTLLRISIPHSKIHIMFSSLQKMVHKIRTSFGDSEITYCGEDLGCWENYPHLVSS